MAKNYINHGIILEGTVRRVRSFGKVVSIFFQKWGIISGVVRYDLITRYSWLKPLLVALVYI